MTTITLTATQAAILLEILREVAEYRPDYYGGLWAVVEAQATKEHTDGTAQTLPAVQNAGGSVESRQSDCLPGLPERAANHPAEKVGYGNDAKLYPGAGASGGGVGGTCSNVGINHPRKDGGQLNAYQQGREAYIRKERLTANPYFLGTADWKQWRQGWLDSISAGKRK